MNFMNFCHCDTIPQFKIGEWLLSKGVTQDDIDGVELLDHSTVRITNSAGLYLTIRWADGRAALI